LGLFDECGEKIAVEGATADNQNASNEEQQQHQKRYHSDTENSVKSHRSS
jgi:hypothetical protein